MTTTEALFDDLDRLLRSPEAEGPLTTLRDMIDAGDPQAWTAMVWFLRGVWAAGGMPTRTTAELIERVRAAANERQGNPADCA